MLKEQIWNEKSIIIHNKNYSTKKLRYFASERLEFRCKVSLLTLLYAGYNAEVIEIFCINEFIYFVFSAIILRIHTFWLLINLSLFVQSITINVYLLFSCFSKSKKYMLFKSSDFREIIKLWHSVLHSQNKYHHFAC